MNYNLETGYFSDGYIIDWYANSDAPPKLWDTTTDDYKEMTEEHKNALVSNTPKTLVLQSSSHFTHQITLPAPVTVGALLDAMMTYYRGALTDQDKETLRTNNELRHWNPHMYPDYPTLFASINTYGCLLGDHVAFAGFEQNNNIIKPEFDS